MRAVALLSAWKTKNALRTLFSDPRKLFPLVVFLILIGLAVTASSLGLSRPKPPDPQHVIDATSFSVGVTMALILLGLSFIDSGLGDGLLAFGLPDVDYLFPSPIARRVVLAYRLPALMFGGMFMAGFVLLTFSFVTNIAHPSISHPGHTISAWWVAPAALFLSGGIYMNLAMFISVRVNDRKNIHKVLMGVILAVIGALGLLTWLKGFGAVEAIVQSTWVRWTFLPSSLASDALIAGYMHRPTGGFLAWLLLGYVISLIPMFASNANWYEQSIVSTERLTAFRQAAKGGYASLTAAKASSMKYKGVRTYTIPPFGQGAGALFWAHLCAAAKKPGANFIGPLLGGIGAGIFAAACTKVNSQTEGLGYTALGMVAFYCSLGFMTTAKTACESAIRRRELLAPLPIPGWQSVAANLGSPLVTALLFFFGFALTYCLIGGSNWPIVGIGLATLIPLRLAARMILQYIVAIGYPDVADKFQQFLSVGVYALVSMPFIFLEIIVCIPGIIFRSVWGILIPLTLIQIPLGALFLYLAGKATERAIATGEPVRITGVIAREKR